MIITTTESIDGMKLEILGIAKGSTVHSKHIGKDFMAGLKTIVGGEISGYRMRAASVRTRSSAFVTQQAPSCREQPRLWLTAPR